MSRVTDFFRQIFIPATSEEQKPRFVPGQPVAGSKHYLKEQEQQQQTNLCSLVVCHRVAGSIGADKKCLR
jgi:hypothetical protein